MIDATVDARLQAVRHELVNPTSVIQHAVQTLRAHGDHLDESRRSELLAAIQRTASLLQSVYETLEDAVDEHFADRVQPRNCDVGALVRYVVSDMEWKTRRHDVELRVPVRLRAIVDPEAVQRILIALLVNAVKFSPARTSILVAAEGMEDWVRVRVADSGPGVPPEAREKIFDKYVRLNTSVPGTGLGLYIARELARAHGGNLNVPSSNGRGAVFVLRLPRVAVARTELTHDGDPLEDPIFIEGVRPP